MGPGPWGRFCPLCLVSWEVGRVGFVKLTEHHGRDKHRNAENEDFSLSKTHVAPQAQSNRKE